jgi:hypothetical protein
LVGASLFRVDVLFNAFDVEDELFDAHVFHEVFDEVGGDFVGRLDFSLSFSSCVLGLEVDERIEECDALGCAETYFCVGVESVGEWCFLL